MADPSLAVSREVYDRMSVIGNRYQVDRITIVSAERLKEKGYDLNAKMPGTKFAIYLTTDTPSSYSFTTDEIRSRIAPPVAGGLRLGLGYANYDIAREIEKMGYSVMPNMSSLNAYV